MSNYKLIAIGGPKNFQWLPWDGKNYQYRIVVAPKLTAVKFTDDSSLLTPDFTERETVIYQVDVLADPVTRTKRHVYKFEGISQTQAEIMLMQHLLDMFVQAGDIEE